FTHTHTHTLTHSHSQILQNMSEIKVYTPPQCLLLMCVSYYVCSVESLQLLLVLGDGHFPVQLHGLQHLQLRSQLSGLQLCTPYMGLHGHTHAQEHTHTHTHTHTQAHTHKSAHAHTRKSTHTHTHTQTHTHSVYRVPHTESVYTQTDTHCG